MCMTSKEIKSITFTEQIIMKYLLCGRPCSRHIGSFCPQQRSWLALLSHSIDSGIPSSWTDEKGENPRLHTYNNNWISPPRRKFQCSKPLLGNNEMLFKFKLFDPVLTGGFRDNLGVTRDHLPVKCCGGRRGRKIPKPKPNVNTQ